MDITAAVTVLAALLSTFISALAIQAHWTAGQKRIASGIVALVLGALATIATNQVDGVPADWVSQIGKWLIVAATVASLAQGAYSQFKGLLDSLSQATTITPAADTEDVAADDGQDGTTEGTAGLPDTSSDASTDPAPSTEDA